MESGQVYGDTVNTAARMVEIALGGQIILSEQAASRLTGPQREKARRFDEVCVKGKKNPIVIYDLVWTPLDTTAIAPVLMHSNNKPGGLTLRYLDETYSLEPAEGQFRIGRSPENDLVVNADSVSRKHGSIAFGRDRFVLSDTSTNGTYVCPEGGESIYLRRESMPLWGRGQFALGVPIPAGCIYTIRYNCG
jgi:hypothetical protein